MQWRQWAAIKVCTILFLKVDLAVSEVKVFNMQWHCRYPQYEDLLDSMFGFPLMHHPVHKLQGSIKVTLKHTSVEFQGRKKWDCFNSTEGKPNPNHTLMQISVFYATCSPTTFSHRKSLSQQPPVLTLLQIFQRILVLTWQGMAGKMLMVRGSGAAPLSLFIS